jgi:tetratricopeptide (TPR) repeat protein
MADWYRIKTWTKDNEANFFARLNHFPKDSRAQYLKIQAIELIETKDKELLFVAEGLLNKVLEDYPDNKIETSSVFNALGNIYRIREEHEKAVDYYKKSLDFETCFPNIITTSYLDYSELIIITWKKERFDFVESLLEKKLPGEIFPASKYKICSILSILNKEKGNDEKSKCYADLAEKSANAKTSGLYYHKYLGVVKERNSWLDKLVKRK